MSRVGMQRARSSSRLADILTGIHWKVSLTFSPTSPLPMNKKSVVYLIFICTYLVACSDKETKKSCYYCLDQLLTLDSPKALSNFRMIL
jgi:hypothetical protein